MVAKLILRIMITTRNNKLFLSGLFLISLLILVACGSDITIPVTTPEQVAAFKAEKDLNNGNAANGQKVFTRLPCLTCHVLSSSGQTPTTGVIAPPLDKVGTTAATRLAGVSAVQYLRHALVMPNDLALQDYRKVMPGFGNSLTTQELDDLEAYLLTLK